MAELVREVVIDATPETIWPFLIDPEQHVRWIGTEAEIDPRPGGTYRVLVAGEHPGRGELVEVVPQEKVVFTLRLGRARAPDPGRLDDGGDRAASPRDRRRACA